MNDNQYFTVTDSMNGQCFTRNKNRFGRKIYPFVLIMRQFEKSWRINRLIALILKVCYGCQYFSFLKLYTSRSFFSAYRFFNEEAKKLNRVRPELTRENEIHVEQAGCLHTSMDLFNWTLKIFPFVQSALLVEV